MDMHKILLYSGDTRGKAKEKFIAIGNDCIIGMDI